jgi:hypothetical protein
MTKEQYMALKNVQLKDWTYEQCQQADALIKVMATTKFTEIVESWNLPKSAQEYLIMMVRLHFGSVETDGLLTALNCYPDWMFSSE